MTDNRTTELREKLTERGVKMFHSGPNVTYFETPYGEAQATEYEPGVFGVMMKDLTPEQAIAATLGSEREKELEELVHDWQVLAEARLDDEIAQSKRITKLEELVRDAYWLIVRAIWSHESQDKFAADWTERVSVLGIEVD